MLGSRRRRRDFESGTERSLALFRNVLLASASIPGVFPPVLINVEAGGKVRQEMHVDGGTTDNAVLLPISTNLKAIDRQLRLWTRADLDWALERIRQAIAAGRITPVMEPAIIAEALSALALRARKLARPSQAD